MLKILVIMITTRSVYVAPEKNMFLKTQGRWERFRKILLYILSVLLILVIAIIIIKPTTLITRSALVALKKKNYLPKNLREKDTMLTEHLWNHLCTSRIH